MVITYRPNGYWSKNRCKKLANKCKTRSEFFHRFYHAYTACQKKGWLTEMCSHMSSPIHKSGYWNVKKNVFREAKKYIKKSDFKKESGSAYRGAIRNGWLDEICLHMNPSKKPNNYWNYTRCKACASKCNSKIEFQITCPSAYNSAHKNGWLEKICKHMKSKQRSHGFWNNKNRCAKEAKKYSCIRDFQKGSGGAFNRATKNGWLEEITAHMEKQYGNNRKWTKDKCLKEALNHKYRIDFKKSSPSAYRSASNKGWLDEICLHMKPLGHKYKRQLYAFEFPDKSVYVGLTYNYDSRYNEHMSKNKLIIKKTNEMGHTFVMFNTFYSYDVVGKKEALLIDKYRKKGWKILNKAKAGGLGGAPRLISC